MEFLTKTAIVLIVLYSLYLTCPAVKYVVKYAVYSFLVTFTSLIVIPYALLRPCDVRNIVVFARFIGPILNYLLDITWQVKNEHILKEDQACIVVSNHQSVFDFLGIVNLWPVMKKCTIVGKKELLYCGPFGVASWLCGGVFIDRSNSKGARAKLSESMKKIKEQKIKCWVFPEGTRSDSGILPFKKGAFYLAITEGLPIIPVVYSKYNFIDHKKRKYENDGDMLINVLDPIPTEGLSKEDVPRLMEEVRSKIIEEHNLLNDALDVVSNARIVKSKSSHLDVELKKTKNV